MNNENKKPYIEKVNIKTSLEELMPVMEECLAAGQSVKFSPKGVSMLPMIRQGKDSVSLSSPPDKLKKYDIALYRRKDGHFVLHRIVCVGDTYTCIGDNQFIFEKGIEHGQIIALCTAITKNGKTTSVYSAKWRLYARFWHYSRFPRRVVRGVFRRIKRFLNKKK